MREAEEANRAAAAARKATEDASKGTRTVIRYALENHKEALHWIAVNDRDAMTAFIEAYVKQHHKAKQIAGVRVWQDRESF